MKHYKLESHLTKMAETELPSTYQHLLRGIGDSAETKDFKGDLAGLLKGVPFDRPIELIPENILRNALQLPPASKIGPRVHVYKDGTEV
jgi:hypothetical protein